VWSLSEVEVWSLSEVEVWSLSEVEVWSLSEVEVTINIVSASLNDRICLLDTLISVNLIIVSIIIHKRK
jgi:hypothetical protein